MEQAMAIEDGVTKPGIPHPGVEPLVVSAFRQPDAKRTLPKQAMMFTDCGSQLAPNCFGVVTQKREIAMGCTAGQEIDHANALESSEPADQISTAISPGLALLANPSAR